MTRTLARFAVFVFALTISLTAFAGSKSQDITLYHDAQLNGTTIPAGHYTMRCDTTGATAQVKFLKGKKEVASATGQTKQLSNSANETALVLQNSGQVPSISEIHFSGSNTAISFEPSMANASAGQ
jgi:hypothetical protein